MRDIDENDAEGLVVLIEAANNLDAFGLDCKSIDDFDTKFRIAMLRSAAFGWREIKWVFKTSTTILDAREARHDANLCARFACASDRQADCLCKTIGLQFEFQGYHQSQASLFWTAFKNLYLELRTANLVWSLVAHVLVRTDNELGLMLDSAREVTHGGTPQRRDIWNERAKALKPIVVQKCAERDAALAQIEANGLSAEMFNDDELMHYGYSTVTAMRNLLGAYRRESAQAASVQ